MGYQFTVLAVDLPALLAAVGSRRPGFADAIATAHPFSVERVDAGYAEVEADERADAAETGDEFVDIGPHTVRQALGELIDGALSVPVERPTPSYAWLYGAALELLCRHFGQELPNTAEQVHMNWFDQVNRSLADAGVPEATFRMARLTYDSLPVTMPDPGDYVTFGHVRHADAAGIVAALSDAALSALHPTAAADLREIRGWLETVDRLGLDLVGILDL